MTDFKDAGAPAATRVVCADSLGAAMLRATARAVRGRDCRGLDRVPMLGQRSMVREELRLEALAYDAVEEALPVALAARLDADAVASWIAGHYPAEAYPAVVLGSPHGGAAHLCAALGAPWLPDGFTVTVPWPGGSVGDWEGAMDWGSIIADAIVAANPDVTVRQVHDPVQRGSLCGTTVTLHVRWRRLPAAYRGFLHTRLEPGAAALVVRDVRTWPVLDLAPGHSFQLGSPVSGWTAEDYSLDNPAFRRTLAGLEETRWAAPYPDVPQGPAELSGEADFGADLRRCATAPVRIRYARPPALSTFVAGLYRRWLADERGGGEHCVIGCGALLDPWLTLAAGLVPYWLEAATRQSVDATEWWLAGSEGFDTITVLPQPPGSRSEAYAPAGQWRSVASFARLRPHLDSMTFSHYPQFPLPTAQASAVLATATPVGAVPPPKLTADEVLTSLRTTGAALGLLVS
ncbi:hypothetical protein [Pseudosporangium ferrugineum]|uniref:Uncharacterized protein n=1 Tax=Pseudosporangium ferrugineum TaxID=439699 RepID=A0A2T0SFZ6_9ACTN|nr:hypothetical protein [Pseudosporangium ferrugineum]PRY32344.1 hypothetical protein CLV70_102555 [Pseudosporangium ferrugineum]